MLALKAFRAGSVQCGQVASSLESVKYELKTRLTIAVVRDRTNHLIVFCLFLNPFVHYCMPLFTFVTRQPAYAGLSYIGSFVCSPSQWHQ